MGTKSGQELYTVVLGRGVLFTFKADSPAVAAADAVRAHRANTFLDDGQMSSFMEVVVFEGPEDLCITKFCGVYSL